LNSQFFQGRGGGLWERSPCQINKRRVFSEQKKNTAAGRESRHVPQRMKGLGGDRGGGETKGGDLCRRGPARGGGKDGEKEEKGKKENSRHKPALQRGRSGLLRTQGKGCQEKKRQTKNSPKERSNKKKTRRRSRRFLPANKLWSLGRKEEDGKREETTLRKTKRKARTQPGGGKKGKPERKGEISGAVSFKHNLTKRQPRKGEEKGLPVKKRRASIKKSFANTRYSREKSEKIEVGRRMGGPSPHLH